LRICGRAADSSSGSDRRVGAMTRSSLALSPASASSPSPAVVSRRGPALRGQRRANGSIRRVRRSAKANGRGPGRRVREQAGYARSPSVPGIGSWVRRVAHSWLRGKGEASTSGRRTKRLAKISMRDRQLEEVRSARSKASASTAMNAFGGVDRQGFVLWFQAGPYRTSQIPRLNEMKSLGAGKHRASAASLDESKSGGAAGSACERAAAG
jgi:hypothetical protein